MTLDATLDHPSITIVSFPNFVTINTVLAGTNGLEKLGAGTLVLAATNTYTYGGPTIVSSGTLRLNGKIGSGKGDKGDPCRRRGNESLINSACAARTETRYLVSYSVDEARQRVRLLPIER